RYVWLEKVPPKMLNPSPVTIEFELDRWGKDSSTGRDIGLIAVSVNLTHPDSIALSREGAIEAAREDYNRIVKRRKQELPIEKQNEMMKLFHEIPVWMNTWFQNVRIEKNPLDLWMMQQLIYELHPDFIVETGTWHGGSALYWAYTLNGMGLENSR